MICLIVGPYAPSLKPRCVTEIACAARHFDHEGVQYNRAHSAPKGNRQAHDIYLSCWDTLWCRGFQRLEPRIPQYALADFVGARDRFCWVKKLNTKNVDRGFSSCQW